MTINNSQLGYNTGASEYNIYKTNATVKALLESNNNVAIRNSIIISSPIDETSYYDIKKPAILMTDNNGYFLPLTYSMDASQFNYLPYNNSVQLNSSYINSVIFSEHSGIQRFPVGCKTQIYCYYTSLSNDIVPSNIAHQIIYNNDGKNKKQIHLGETIGINEKYYNKHTYFFNIVIDPINIKKENIDFSNSINCNIITNDLFDEKSISFISYHYEKNNSSNDTLYFLTLIPKENIDSTNKDPKVLEFTLYDDETNFERIFKYNFAIVEQNDTNKNLIFIPIKNGVVEPTATATPTPTNTSTNTPSINSSVTPDTTK